MSNVQRALSSGWITYAPTITPAGAMTYTGVTFYYAKYCIIDKMVFVIVGFDGTVGGTPNSSMALSLPVTAATGYAFRTASFGNTTTNSTVWWYAGTTSACNFTPEGFVNFSAGAVGAAGSFFYEKA